jgi:hypothetical protein
MPGGYSTSPIFYSDQRQRAVNAQRRAQAPFFDSRRQVGIQQSPTAAPQTAGTNDFGAPIAGSSGVQDHMAATAGLGVSGGGAPGSMDSLEQAHRHVGEMMARSQQWADKALPPGSGPGATRTAMQRTDFTPGSSDLDQAMPSLRSSIAQNGAQTNKALAGVAKTLQSPSAGKFAGGGQGLPTGTIPLAAGAVAASMAPFPNWRPWGAQEDAAADTNPDARSAQPPVPAWRQRMAAQDAAADPDALVKSAAAERAKMGPTPANYVADPRAAQAAAHSQMRVALLGQQIAARGIGRNGGGGGMMGGGGMTPRFQVGAGMNADIMAGRASTGYGAAAGDPAVASWRKQAAAARDSGDERRASEFEGAIAMAPYFFGDAKARLNEGLSAIDDSEAKKAGIAQNKEELDLRRQNFELERQKMARTGDLDVFDMQELNSVTTPEAIAALKERVAAKKLVNQSSQQQQVNAPPGGPTTAQAMPPNRPLTELEARTYLNNRGIPAAQLEAAFPSRDHVSLPQSFRALTEMGIGPRENDEVHNRLLANLAMNYDQAGWQHPDQGPGWGATLRALPYESAETGGGMHNPIVGLMRLLSGVAGYCPGAAGHRNAVRDIRGAQSYAEFQKKMDPILKRFAAAQIGPIPTQNLR